MIRNWKYTFCLRAIYVLTDSGNLLKLTPQ
jgi:hypothetical protein